MLTGKPKITTSVYKTKKPSSSAGGSKRPYQRLEGPGTLVLDGHPDVVYKDGYSAADVYPTTIYGDIYKEERLYNQLERMDIIVAQYVGKVTVSTDNWDWSRVTLERGNYGYTIQEMKEKIQQHGMVPPANARREDLVKFLLENKLKLL
jgi:hypothetical protein